MHTRIVLLQDAVYLPSYGGGNKANRLLLTELAARGCDCHAVSRIAGDRHFLAQQFSAAGLAARGIAVTAEAANRMSYSYRGVQVEALELPAAAAITRIAALLREVDPDWILVSDDRHAVLLDVALRYASDRVVVLVHTHVHLPFGPEADAVHPEQHARMRAARGIVAASEYSRTHLRNFGGLDSSLQRFPVFSNGPFEPSSGADSGCVTMINPCLIKGLPIFLELAALFPEVPFAAVPTWGGDEAVICELSQLPNMTVLEPADDVGAVLRGTRVLLAPSLIPETFGYVAVDAMLRGIPVLSGHLGGQPEAKLGVDYVLPVAPARRTATGYVVPPQDVAPWRDTLRALLSDRDLYRRCALASRDAALRFLPQTDAIHFANYLNAL